MRKEVNYLIYGTLGVLLISFVSAYNLGGGLGHGVSQLIYLVESMIYPLAFSLFGSIDYVFEKFLFLAIIISLVYVVLSNVPLFQGEDRTKRSVRWIVTLAVGLLATRFMTEIGIIQTMIMPYTVLGVVLTSILPIVIYFFFVINGFRGTTLGHSVMRKVLWLFFGVVFLGIWNSRASQLGELSWVYFGTAILAFVFLLLDGTINRALIRAKYGELDRNRILEYIAKEKEHLDDVEEWKRTSKIEEGDYKRMKKQILKNLRQLQKGL